MPEHQDGIPSKRPNRQPSRLGIWSIRFQTSQDSRPFKKTTGYQRMGPAFPGLEPTHLGGGMRSMLTIPTPATNEVNRMQCGRSVGIGRTAFALRFLALKPG